MLKIINDLKPFFEDCYRRINVREYAKLKGISPPTASSLLEHYRKEQLLQVHRFRNYKFYTAYRDSSAFVALSRMYWRELLAELISYVEDSTITPTIILFGSLSKAEAKPDSDVDIAIVTYEKKLNFETFEKKLGRDIQVFWFPSIKKIRSTELANNIINGYVLSGRIKL